MTPLLLTAALATGHPPQVTPVPTYSPVPAIGFYPPGGYPVPLPRPIPGPFPPLPPAIPTVEEFARLFQPFPGPHRAVVLHPRTGRPVEVSFVLPDTGRPPKVNSGKRFVEFDYGKIEVRIEFKSNGTVEVDYDD